VIRNNNFKLLSFLFFFLFGGAIVGETVSLTMVVTILGPASSVNYISLMALFFFYSRPCFFQNIDKVNRGKLLSIQLLVSAGILTVYFIGIHAIEMRAVQTASDVSYPDHLPNFLSVKNNPVFNLLDPCKRYLPNR